MQAAEKFTCAESILLLTAFAASAVDVIGFGELGKVFASAMTGNFALLAYHTAERAWSSAAGALVALSGFVVGCIAGYVLRRDRRPQQALHLLLQTEVALLSVFAAYALWAGQRESGVADPVQIALLAVAMGLQSVIGQIISLTTIVFTTTLTRLVGNAVDCLFGHREQLREMRVQGAVVICYLCGALLSAYLVIRHIALVVLLPLIGVAMALVSQRHAARRASQRPVS
ncbi:MAG: DUF1275 domain-containing protein [Sinobacteraceae bacterium]|nr:DUF1275 domain-containing protein [Nevskiaceae bacterium]